MWYSTRQFKNYIIKVKYILPTFLIISLIPIFGVMFLRWLFSIQNEILDINEEIWEFYLPTVVTVISIIIWLRPKFRIITFHKYNERRRFNYF
jgi:rhomboid protease GluP